MVSLRRLRSTAGCSLALPTPAAPMVSLRRLRSTAGCSLALPTPAWAHEHWEV